MTRHGFGWLSAILLGSCGTPAPPSDCPGTPAAANRARPDYSPFQRIPRGRLGSIPCPGPLTAFTTADPARLGTHSYTGTTGETRRGIIYTRHGGFIDIAHTRKAADWTGFHQVRIQHALEENRDCIILPSKEGSIYQVNFNCPGWWSKQPEPRRREMIRELSIRLAQRLAITQTEWHEIVSWFGYSASPYTEKPSAFTYDDMTSHVLGAVVAGRALREGGNFDAAVTRHLARELDRLKAVSPDETMKALAMVEGDWWRNGFVIRRQIDTGQGDNSIRPWIVPGYPDGSTAAAHEFELPSLANIAGRDLRRFARVEIEPNMRLWSKMRRGLPGNPDRCRPAEHFPILLDHIRLHERGR